MDSQGRNRWVKYTETHKSLAFCPFLYLLLPSFIATPTPILPSLILSFIFFFLSSYWYPFNLEKIHMQYVFMSTNVFACVGVCVVCAEAHTPVYTFLWSPNTVMESISIALHYFYWGRVSSWTWTHLLQLI